MRCISVCSGLTVGALCLVGCGAGGGISGSSYNPGYGPFDANGNYVEEWADSPAKKHWWARESTPEPTKSEAREDPPQFAATTRRQSPQAASSTRRVQAPSLPASRPPAVARAERPTAQPSSRATASTSSTPPPPKPKPKPAVVKPSKPAPVKHVVKSGDTLYSLSRKYGTSVSAIQRANGLSGTTIVLGKTLSIPR